MTEPELTIATLPPGNLEKAIELAEKLHKQNRLTPDMLSMIMMSCGDSDALLEALERRGIDAEER